MGTTGSTGIAMGAVTGISMGTTGLTGVNGVGTPSGGLTDGKSVDRGAVMTMVPLRIVGRRLPGSSWSGRHGIHVGVQRGTEVVDLVIGDAADAVFDIELDLVATPDEGVDFRGPYVHGRRGERFVYLTWGEVHDDGEFMMFRRLKLHLAPLAEQSATDSLLAAKRLQAVLELTDTRGRPLAASVRPPWVTWRVLNSSRA